MSDLQSNTNPEIQQSPDEQQGPSLPIQAPPVTLKFKKSQPIEIEIDLDALTWEDNLLFSKIAEKSESGEMPEDETFAALNRILSKITGQDVSKMPARHVSAIIAEIGKLSSAENQERKN